MRTGVFAFEFAAWISVEFKLYLMVLILLPGFFSTFDHLHAPIAFSILKNSKNRVVFHKK